jgi:hypothetical protein
LTIYDNLRFAIFDLQPDVTRRQADAGPKSHIVNRKPSIVNRQSPVLKTGHDPEMPRP